jgi:hypothetical protein
VTNTLAYFAAEAMTKRKKFDGFGRRRKLEKQFEKKTEKKLINELANHSNNNNGGGGSNSKQFAYF